MSSFIMSSSITRPTSSGTASVVIGDPQSGGAWYTSKRIPLRQLQLPRSLIPRDAKRAEAVAKLIELQPAQLEEWDGNDGFTCQLPTTSFEGRHGLTPLSALMRRPDASELPDLVRDETGAQRSLTPEMILALKRNGRFSFPSAAHPPLEHVWQLPSWLQRGSVRIRTDFLAWIGCAVDQLLVHCKRRIDTPRKQVIEEQKERRTWWPKAQFSVWKGVKNLLKGAFCLVHLIVGLPVYRPRHSQYELEDKFGEEETKFLLSNADEDMDMRLYLDERCNAKMSDMRKSSMYSNLYLCDNRYSGMTDKEIRVERAREYSSIFNTQEENSDQERSEGEGEVESDAVEIEGEVQCNADEYERMDKIVADHRTKSDREALLHELEYHLAGSAPDIQALAKAELKANFIRADIMAKASNAVKARREEVELCVREEAPLRSLGSLWLREEVHNRMRTRSPEVVGNALERVARGEIEGQEFRYKVSAIHSGLEDQVVEALEAQGHEFSQEARLERLRLRFRRERWPVIENMMIQERVPAIEMTHRRIKYRTRNWQIGEDGELQMFKETKTSSSFLGWRLVGLARNTWTHAVNGLFNIIVVNLWGSSLGIQALFRSRMFFVGRPGNPMRRHTLVTRLRAIWRDVREKRMEFEASEDTGFVSKNAVRWLHYIRNYVLRGAVASVFVAVLQPFLTTLNIVISSVLVLTVPVWPLLLTVLSSLFCALVYDLYADYATGVVYVRSYDVSPYEDRYIESDVLSGGLFPLLQIAWRVVGSGAGQSILSAFCAVVVHPLLALGSATFGAIAALFRTVTDAAFRGLLARFGRWPATNSWLAQRVSGPGISSNYYYRVSQDVISQCVRARLEKIELKIVQDKLFAVIREPEKAFELYCVDTTRHIFIHGTPFTLAFFSDSVLGERLLEQGDKMRHRLILRLRRRKKSFDALLRMPVDRNRIRPASEPALAVTDNVDAVRTFYERRLKPLGEEYSLDLWTEAAIPMGDMFGLTRYLLRSIFCQEFLRELKVSDEDLVIPVSFDGVLDLDNLQIDPSRDFRHYNLELD